jgi:hypothetical protein
MMLFLVPPTRSACLACVILLDFIAVIMYLVKSNSNRASSYKILSNFF